MIDWDGYDAHAKFLALAISPIALGAAGQRFVTIHISTLTERNYRNSLYRESYAVTPPAPLYQAYQ